MSKNVADTTFKVKKRIEKSTYFPHKNLKTRGIRKIEVCKVQIKLSALIKINQGDREKSSSNGEIRKIRCLKNRGATVFMEEHSPC